MNRPLHSTCVTVWLAASGLPGWAEPPRKGLFAEAYLGVGVLNEQKQGYPWRESALALTGPTAGAGLWLTSRLALVGRAEMTTGVAADHWDSIIQHPDTVSVILVGPAVDASFQHFHVGLQLGVGLVYASNDYESKFRGDLGIGVRAGHELIRRPAGALDVSVDLTRTKLGQTYEYGYSGTLYSMTVLFGLRR